MLTVEKVSLMLANNSCTQMKVYSAYAKKKLPGTQTYMEEAEGVIDYKTIAGRVILSEEKIYLDLSLDENADYKTKFADVNVKDIMYVYCIPINVSGGSTVGALQIINGVSDKGEVENFSSQQLHHLIHFSEIASVALSNLKLSQEREIAQGRIQSLLKMSRSVSKELNAQSVLERIVDVSYELLDADRIAIFTKVPGEELLYVSHAQDAAKGKYISSKNGIAGLVATKGELLSVDDVYNHPAFDKTIDKLTNYRTKSILCAPVHDTEGNVLAVVEAINKRNGSKFTSEDALFLTYVAEAAGISLHKSNLHQEALMAKQLIEMRLKLTGSIEGTSQDKIENFVEIAMSEGTEFMGVDRFGLLLVDYLKNELWISSSKDDLDIRTPMGEGISGLVAETGETIVLQDAYDHPAFDSSVDKITGIRTTSVICMPVFEHQRPGLKGPRKVVAVAMAINRKRGGRTVDFNVVDRKNMENICKEIELAVAQLSLEMSYFKVFSDDALNKDKHEQTTAASLILYYHRDHETTFRGRGTTKCIRSDTMANAFTPRSDIDMWTFDAFSLKPNEFGHTVCQMFASYGIESSPTLYKFVSTVEDKYLANPFHNFYHGIQTMHSTHIMLRFEAEAAFKQFELIALLVAALCHDVGHPGNNNDFEVKSSTSLAIMHNDDAVLERHHCRLTFEILRKQGCNIFENIPSEEYRSIRKLIISGILATDMTKHFMLCKRIETISREELFSETIGLAEIIAHAADLSAQALPYLQAKAWEGRILEEFISQVEKEKEEGLPVAPFMENLTDRKTAANLQVNFITFVLFPLWKPLIAIMPQLQVNICYLA